MNSPMTDREKLVESISSVEYKSGWTIGERFCRDWIEMVADQLIAKGVTVNNWRDARTDPPDNDLRVLVTVTANVDPKGSRMDTDRMKNGRWVRWGHLVSKWMPLPKEETK